MIYTITYDRPYNPHTSYYRNSRRNVYSVIVKGTEAARAKAAELTAAGHTLRVRDYTGKLVTM